MAGFLAHSLLFWRPSRVQDADSGSVDAGSSIEFTATGTAPDLNRIPFY